MDFQLFIDHGYLQELNRQFLHPLGLALEIQIDDDGKPSDSCRIVETSDPAGKTYRELPTVESHRKALTVEIRRQEIERARVQKYGFIIQPID